MVPMSGLCKIVIPAKARIQVNGPRPASEPPVRSGQDGAALVRSLYLLTEPFGPADARYAAMTHEHDRHR